MIDTEDWQRKSEVHIIGIFKGEVQGNEQKNTKSHYSRKIFSDLRDLKLILKRHTRYLGKLTQMANTQIYTNKTVGV